ncbi:MAG: hypothetical protein ACO1QS_21060 [Verrucomicrobiota bacterium]
MRRNLLVPGASLLRAGVVFWVVKDGQRGPVELSFVGMKIRVIPSGGSREMAVFRLRNNSVAPISYRGRAKQEPDLTVNELRLLGRQMSLFDDIVLTPYYLEWHTLNPGEEIEIERYVSSRNRFWDMELKYVEGGRTGEVRQADVLLSDRPVQRQDEPEWNSAKSGSLWPVNWRP